MSGDGNGVSGYYTGMFILGFVMLFIAVCDLAVGIGNAVVCGMLGSVGYGIWGSVIVSFFSFLHVVMLKFCMESEHSVLIIINVGLIWHIIIRS